MSSRRPAAPLLASALALLAGLSLGACGEGHEFHPPDEEERVLLADSLFSAELFDTIAWENPAQRVDAGNGVFAAECRRCHGTLGRGDTEYARERGLAVPSLVRADWPLAGDIDAVRRTIFVGHVAGMPSWGIHSLSPREIDAVAFYLLEQLRPEVLGP